MRAYLLEGLRKLLTVHACGIMQQDMMLRLECTQTSGPSCWAQSIQRTAENTSPSATLHGVTVNDRTFAFAGGVNALAPGSV